MHILEIASGQGINGAVIHCLELTKGLARCGHQVTLVCRPGSWIADQLADEPVEIVESDLSRFPPNELRRLSRFCRDRKVDLVHTHQSRAHLFGVLMRRLFGGPKTVATAHRSLFQPHWAWNDLVIATSGETARYHHRWNLVPRRKIEVVFNFIQAERFRATPPTEGVRVRQELGLSPEDTVLGLIGNIERRKGLIHLVAALPRLLQISPQVKLLVIGYPNQEYVRQVLQKATELKVADRVLLPGTRQDIPAVLRALDLYVLPSLDESLPLSVLEAMSIGLPVVATKVGGLPECIEDQVDGRLVRPGDPVALAEAIGGLIASPERQAALGRSASLRIDREFSPASQVGKIEALFERLIGRVRQAA